MALLNALTMFTGIALLVNIGGTVYLRIKHAPDKARGRFYSDDEKKEKFSGCLAILSGLAFAFCLSMQFALKFMG
jgi:hypothetical protein